MNLISRRLVFLLFVAGLSACGVAAFGASLEGKITYMEGNVSVDGASANIGDAVPLGATVTTDADSLCEIVFRDRNILRLGAQTTLVFNPGNLQVGSALRQGSLALVLKNLVPAAAGGPSFYVRTGTTAAGVRGTSFYMKVEDSSTTYVCLCNGAITLDDGTVAGKQVESAHHTAYRVSQGANGVTATPAPLLYHTDEDMQTLAGKVGVAIDWSVVDK